MSNRRGNVWVRRSDTCSENKRSHNSAENLSLIPSHGLLSCKFQIYFGILSSLKYWACTTQLQTSSQALPVSSPTQSAPLKHIFCRISSYLNVSTNIVTVEIVCFIPRCRTEDAVGRRSGLALKMSPLENVAPSWKKVSHHPRGRRKSWTTHIRDLPECRAMGAVLAWVPS